MLREIEIVRVIEKCVREREMGRIGAFAKVDLDSPEIEQNTSCDGRSDKGGVGRGAQGVFNVNCLRLGWAAG